MRKTLVGVVVVDPLPGFYFVATHYSPFPYVYVVLCFICLLYYL